MPVRALFMEQNHGLSIAGCVCYKYTVMSTAIPHCWGEYPDNACPYSNTGGQTSKSTAASAIAKFAAGGKEAKKKALGADPAQPLKTIREAEAYPGPSLVIAYCPCIEHGMKCGMGLSQREEKRAVECGCWYLYRYDPRLKKEGKTLFTLNSKEPTGDFQQFLMGQDRCAVLKLSFSEKAERLYSKAESDAKERLQGCRRLTGQVDFSAPAPLTGIGTLKIELEYRLDKGDSLF